MLVKEGYINWNTGNYFVYRILELHTWNCIHGIGFLVSIETFKIGIIYHGIMYIIYYILTKYEYFDNVLTNPSVMM